MHRWWSSGRIGLTKDVVVKGASMPSQQATDDLTTSALLPGDSEFRASVGHASDGNLL